MSKNIYSRGFAGDFSRGLASSLPAALQMAMTFQSTQSNRDLENKLKILGLEFQKKTLDMSAATGRANAASTYQAAHDKWLQANPADAGPEPQEPDYSIYDTSGTTTNTVNSNTVPQAQGLPAQPAPSPLANVPTILQQNKPPEAFKPAPQTMEQLQAEQLSDISLDPSEIEAIRNNIPSPIKQQQVVENLLTYKRTRKNLSPNKQKELDVHYQPLLRGSTQWKDVPEKAYTNDITGLDDETNKQIALNQAYNKVNQITNQLFDESGNIAFESGPFSHSSLEIPGLQIKLPGLLDLRDDYNGVQKTIASAASAIPAAAITTNLFGKAISTLGPWGKVAAWTPTALTGLASLAHLNKPVSDQSKVIGEAASSLPAYAATAFAKRDINGNITEDSSVSKKYGIDLGNNPEDVIRRHIQVTNDLLTAGEASREAYINRVPEADFQSKSKEWTSIQPFPEQYLKNPIFQKAAQASGLDINDLQKRIIDHNRFKNMMDSNAKLQNPTMKPEATPSSTPSSTPAPSISPEDVTMEWAKPSVTPTPTKTVKKGSSDLLNSVQSALSRTPLKQPEGEKVVLKGENGAEIVIPKSIMNKKQEVTQTPVDTAGMINQLAKSGDRKKAVASLVQLLDHSGVSKMMTVDVYDKLDEAGFGLLNEATSYLEKKHGVR